MEKWPFKYRRSTQGVDGIFWVYFRYFSPPVCIALSAAVGHQHPQCAGALSVSLASPATRIPLAQKGGEIPTTKLPLWPKTAGAKGWWFPSPHMDAPRPQGTAEAPLSPEGSSAPSLAPQPSPSEYSQELWNLLYPASLAFGQVFLRWRLEGPSRRPTLGYQ